MVPTFISSLAPGARKPHCYDRPMRGAVLHFFCNPDSFKKQTIEADGVVLFNGDDLDREVLKRY